MKSSPAPFLFALLAFACLSGSALYAADGDSEATVSATLEKAGDRLSRDSDGHVTKIFSGGKEPHSIATLQSLGKLTHLKEIALNNPQGGNDDWAFLHDLPELEVLTIWHCHTIRSLAPFSHLPIQKLTVGGCMGIRDLNKENPDAQRDSILSLVDLPNLTYLNVYHSPVLPDDKHLAHIAKEFPKLETLKIDFAAPRGSEINITPQGLKVLQALPLQMISMENAKFFTPDHIAALCGIPTLQAILIDARRDDFDPSVLQAKVKELRPDVTFAFSGKDNPNPPVVPRTPKVPVKK